jgi:hypothetical protein
MDSNDSIQSQDSAPGVMSEGELRFLRETKALVRAAIEGRVPFSAAMLNLLADQKELRRHGFDADAAFAAGAIRWMRAAALTDSAPPRAHPSAAELAFLNDIEGLIDYAIANGVSFMTVLSPLFHDVGALATYEWSLEKAAADCFHPAATGWAKRNTELAGQVEESVR